MTNLILCGGAGTRLWPLSRSRMPKQFYPLFEGKTIFEETILRNKALVNSFWVASNAVQMELARDQLARSGVESFGSLVEPVGRNTAPAIALVCLALPADEVVFVTPSDHRMTDPSAYAAAVARAQLLAEAGNLVTFGIQPSYPETGYGYIEANGETVVNFKEKPDAATAQKYIDSGRYFWNSGMFVFRAGVFLEELGRHAPEVLTAAQTAYAKCQTSEGLEPSLEVMNSLPSTSIDYAVMEKSSKVKVVVCNPGWSDLGSFDALFDEVKPNGNGNRVLGGQAPVAVDAHNNLVVGSGRKIALVDVEDLLVIDTPDALLIVKRGSSQKVKDVVGELKKEKSGLLD